MIVRRIDWRLMIRVRKNLDRSKQAYFLKERIEEVIFDQLSLIRRVSPDTFIIMGRSRIYKIAKPNEHVEKDRGQHLIGMIKFTGKHVVLPYDFRIMTEEEKVEYKEWRSSATQENDVSEEGLIKLKDVEKTSTSNSVVIDSFEDDQERMLKYPLSLDIQETIFLREQKDKTGVTINFQVRKYIKEYVQYMKETYNGGSIAVKTPFPNGRSITSITLTSTERKEHIDYQDAFNIKRVSDFYQLAIRHKARLK